MSTLSFSDRSVCALAIARHARLEPAELDRGLALFRVCELARGAYLLRAGERATECGIVIAGLLREHYVTSKGVERTKSFVIAGEPTGSAADLLGGHPSRAFIVAEEPTRVACCAWDEYRALTERSPGWGALLRAHLEAVLMHKAEREYEFLCMDAEERYAAFALRYPGLEQRVAGRHIASYLGVTPVHLSRLRRRRIETQRMARLRA